MVSKCTHCGRALNLTEAQRQKIENALASLAPGKSLKFNCPNCQKPVEVRREADAVSGSASAAPAKRPAAAQAASGPVPPAPPDLDWLEKGDLGSGEIIEDVPQVLILIRDEGIKAEVGGIFSDLGYKPVHPMSAEDAVERMRFTEFSIVVLHSDFENGLDNSVFHEHMKGMSMIKRRYIYYVLLGPEFNTLYNLEAMASSANIVINDRELSVFPLILKKGLREYEELFGPYLAALEAVGKR